MKVVVKVLISILFVALSFTCFFFQPPSIVRTTTTSDTIAGSEHTVSESIETNGFSKMLDIVGLGALVLSIWIWRKELGITKVGPLSGEPSVTQQEPGAPIIPSSQGEAVSIDAEPTYADMEKHELKLRKDYVTNLFERYHSLNVSMVAHELRIMREAAKYLLFVLQKEGKLRADGFPKSTIYTKADSVENRTIDLVTRDIERTHRLLQERRFVRISHRYEVDALLKCEEIEFIVEVKIIKGDVKQPTLERWITQITSIAAEFSSVRIACILAIVILGLTRSEEEEQKNRLTSYSYETDQIPVRTVVYTETDISEQAT